MPPVSKNHANEFNRSHLSHPRQKKQANFEKPSFLNFTLYINYNVKKQKSLNQSQKIFLLGSVQQLQQRPWKDQISVESIKATAAFSPGPFISECFFTITCCDWLKPNQTSFISASLSEVHDAFCWPFWLFFCLFQPLWVPILPLYLSPFPFYYQVTVLLNNYQSCVTNSPKLTSNSSVH